jgi:hypothetical protein
MAITKYVGQTFKGATFQLEECWFINCVLHECTIFFSGGSYELENATFDRCQWKFQNQAAQTCRLLNMIGLIPAQQIPPQTTKLSSGPLQ